MESKGIKIMVFGTFDGLHRGHADFFRQAKALSTESFLVVSVARDKNVIKIKGRRPVLKETERVILIEMSGMADKVVLGGTKDHLPHIIKENPAIIALGYDQKEYVDRLKEDLMAQGLAPKIVRLKPYKEHIYKNHLLRSARGI